MNPFNHTKYIKSISLIVILLIIGIAGETTTENAHQMATGTQTTSIQIVTSGETQ